MALELQPISFKELVRFVKMWHRHHPPPRGWKFGCGVTDGTSVVGVICVGRPVARPWDDGWTMEVTRCCTDGTPNACSILYGAAWRASKALGYRRLITYTNKTESGSSLRAAGWKVVGERKARSWNCQGRPRVDRHEITERLLWEAS